jgi:hypothetical protein
MKKCSFQRIIPNNTRRTAFEELRFPCAIFSPESKTPTEAHQNCTGALINRPACRALKCLRAPKLHRFLKREHLSHFAYFNREAKN